jgi:hypothetical protein
MIRMIQKIAPALGLAVLTVLTIACETSKSSNPLSASVAGPIPGVNISAPMIMQPAAGTRVVVDQQPVTLTVGNATTNGVRPLSYLFEVAIDAGFTNKVFTRDSITPGDGGQTSLRLPDALGTGRTYYWHARAQDGANTGSFSTVANFDVFTPIVIQAPVLVSPINGVTVGSVHPTLTFTDAVRTGPAGTITYAIEVADSASFANRVAVWTVAEQPGQTTLVSPQDLAVSKQYFWHVRASDPTTVGPFSTTGVFVTPTPVVILPPPTPPPPTGGGPSGSAPPDAINLATAAVYNSPRDIASWPATGTITNLTMSGAGLAFQFSTQNSWPDVVPPGFAGPLQYTVWAVVNINGQWDTSGFIQMWRGRASTGAPILAEFATNWAYDARWGPMAGYHPHVGEQMGFFLSAGNARGEGGVSSVRERTNVVLVALPAGDQGSFSFSAGRLPFSAGRMPFFSRR